MTTAASAYAFGNCTYYVAERFPKIYPYMGNAINWLTSAKARGYKVLSKPAPDTVVVYGTSYSPLGHVAVVDSVNSDGSFEVSEMNYTGYNVVDKRRSTMNGVMGFVVPPGSTYKAPVAAPKQGECINSINVGVSGAPLGFIQGFLGQKPDSTNSTICIDGLVGYSAMAAGGLLMLSGIGVLVIVALRNTGAAQVAAGAMSAVPGPWGVAAKVASARPRTTAPAAPAGPTPEQASAQRVATAKARVHSPEAESAVSEARAGRGKRLTPAVSQELREDAA